MAPRTPAQADAPARRGALIPHPAYRDVPCYCAEGRIVRGDTITWLPPVHDCQYVAERNAALARRASAHKGKPT